MVQPTLLWKGVIHHCCIVAPHFQSRAISIHRYYEGQARVVDVHFMLLLSLRNNSPDLSITDLDASPVSTIALLCA